MTKPRKSSPEDTEVSAEAQVTPEVGSEGGSPGDVEIDVDAEGKGAEADEIWRPARREVREVVRDETGEGRRSP